MARYMNADGDMVNVGTTAIPTTGSVFCWYYPTFTIHDGAEHNVFRVRNQLAVNSSLRLFDFINKDGANDIYCGWYNPGSDDDRFTSGGANTAGTYLTINTWHSCVFTWTNGGTAQLWINGVSVGSKSGTNTWNTAGVNRIIGNDEFATSNEANGRIAEFTFWNAALDSAERAALDRGWCPRLIRPASITDYLPLWGASSPEPNYWRSTGGTVTGTSKADHPRIIGSVSKRRVGSPTVVAASDVLPRGLSSIEWGEVASRGMHNIETGIVA